MVVCYATVKIALEINRLRYGLGTVQEHIAWKSGVKHISFFNIKPQQNLERPVVPFTNMN